MNEITTIEEARAYRYGEWAGNPSVRAYKDGHCAKEVMDWTSGLFYQCGRRNGHGPHGLYCWQHAKWSEISE